ncbi:MAG: 2-C-methyl-D-erythritol 2,4-cyclodiphosphate synthase [Bacteroidota bacterium]|nr:2-C-methyl-D-erythritol 2,4-cyclodiphosphate synthase [Bacteroidota bacterium]
MTFRTGFGVDFHQLVSGRTFMLGGVEIPHTHGALGHSDADVLLHAICDALLGAACLGDIGVHFPDTSAEFKGIDSKLLLERTVRLIGEAGFQIGNIDSTVCLEAPKIKSFIPAMQQVISSILGIEENAVSIKATTTEKMGFVGRQEGLVAYASTLIYSKNP